MQDDNLKVNSRKRLWIILATAEFLVVAFGVWYMLMPNAEQTRISVHIEDDYTCPMHPQIHSDRPGDCPICGMRLVKRSTLRQTQTGDTTMAEAVMLTGSSAIKANVATVRIERRALRNELHLPGTIQIVESEERAVTARTRGRVEKLYISETGSYIKAGTPLYEYYSPDLASDVAQYIVAKDVALPIASDPGDNHIQLNFEHVARQRLKLYGLTDRQITDYRSGGEVPSTFTIYAPASGTVIRKGALEGAWLDEGTMLFEIAELSTVWANFDVPQEMLPRLKLGQQVSVSASAYPGSSFLGRVIFIYPVLNAETRTARIRVSLVNPGLKLKIQMAVVGNILLYSEKSLAVPASAIVRTGEKSIVWVKRKDGMFYPQEVLLDYRDADDYYVVRGGLEEGDEVAASGTFLIDSERQLKMYSSMPGMDHGNAKPKEQQDQQNNMKGMKM